MGHGLRRMRGAQWPTAATAQPQLNDRNDQQQQQHFGKDNDEDTPDNAHDTGQHMMLLKNCTNYLSLWPRRRATVLPQMKSFRTQLLLFI